MNPFTFGGNPEPPRRAPRNLIPTVCERCRWKRIKCDEDKPRCGRCAKAGAQCQYPVKQLQIREYGAPRGRKKNDVISSRKAKHALNDRRSERLNANAEEPVVSDALGPRDGISDLLNHYRRVVAPWLDACDPSQTFGRLILRQSSLSPSLLNALLSLSSASSSHLLPSSLQPPNSLVKFANILSLAGRDALEVNVSWTLGKAKLFVQTHPEDWTSGFSVDGPPPMISHLVFGDSNGETYDSDAIRMMWLAARGLTVRLELAASLMREASPAIDSAILNDVLAKFRTSDANNRNSAFAVTEACLTIVGITLDVVRLCIARPVEHDRDQTSEWPTKQQRRETLLTRLTSWYHTRPDDLRPLLKEQEGTSRLWLGAVEGEPVPGLSHVFCTEAGVCANMLYHTAQHLLLPPDISQREQHHLQAIFEIGTSSDRKAWDPCMIACFAFAARRLLDQHDGQAEAKGQVLRCLQEVMKFGGWNVQGLLEKFRKEKGNVSISGWVGSLQMSQFVHDGDPGP